MADATNLVSHNFQDHYIRHRDFVGELTTWGEPTKDFYFELVNRGGGKVSIRSQNFPKRFLRHRGFKIYLDEPTTADKLFGPDSTFDLVAGLAGSGVSFRSTNYPTRYIRHRDFHLWLEEPANPGDALFRADATFHKSVRLSEPELNPV